MTERDDEERDKVDEAMAKAMAEIRRLRPNTIFTELDRETGDMKISFSDFDQPWIDKIIKSFLPGVEVYPPLIASGWFGEFFHEFDTWRAFHDMSRLKSFQGVLIRTPDLKTACLRLSRRDEMTNWYGKPFEGNEVGVFCIDRGLVDYLARSFYYAIVTGYPAEPALNMWLDTGLVRNAAQDQTISLDASEIAAITQGRTTFRQIASELNFISDTPGPGNLLAAACKDASKPTEVGPYLDIWKYCLSMSIHFLMGHEFGHYAYKNGEETFSVRAARFTDQLVNRYSITDPDLVEEVFCDIVGLDNCLFQMNYFDVPPAITVCLTAWALLLVNHLAALEPGVSQNSRLVAWTKYWGHRRWPRGAQELASAAETAMLGLRPAAEVVAKRQIALRL